tara:strand:- start:5419 stop:6084 length:666 start_codon:yes stop_codon:yes gene_type:complete
LKIGIITYNIPHLKTQDVFFNLLERNYKISLIITKFKKFKNRTALQNHRPIQFQGPNPYDLSKKFNLKISNIENIRKYKDIKFFLICGATIIEKKYIIKNKIINCHPGLIPMRRGLDAFKWSILKNEVLGNTLHFIDENVDYGKIISHKKTPIFKSDSIQTLIDRHYKMEIDMLVNFEKYLSNPKIFNLKTQEPCKRMPIAKERKMIKNFKKYKNFFTKKK